MGSLAVSSDARRVKRAVVPIAVRRNRASNKEILSGAVVERLLVVDGDRREEALHDRHAIAADRGDDAVHACGRARVRIAVRVPVVASAARLRNEDVVGEIAVQSKVSAQGERLPRRDEVALID